MDVKKLMKNNHLVSIVFVWVEIFLACDNILYIEDWEVEMLIPSNITFVREAMLVIFDEDTWD